MFDQIDAFPAAYVVERADPATTAIASHQFCADGVSTLAPSFEIDVTPSGASPWRGAFFGGRDELTEVVSSPSPHHLIAVAGGVAYLVPVLAPESREVASLRPVRSVEVAPSAGVIVLVGFTSVLAIGGSGTPIWTSGRLVSDGFTEVRLTTDSLVLRGFDAPSDAEVEMMLSLDTGAIGHRG